MIVSGQVVRTLRHRHDLTQTELGMLCGIYQQHVSDIERGVKVHLHPSTLVRLSEALGVPMEELVCAEPRGEGTPPSGSRQDTHRNAPAWCNGGARGSIALRKSRGNGNITMRSLA